jgi:hypothetical protein
MKRGRYKKKKILFISAIMFFSLLMFFYANGQQQAQWEGRIEYKEGVKVIKNPNEPLYGEITFDLEEDLSIGNEDDENYMFYRGIKIEVDNDGNIYVLDRGNHRIQKYDKNGRYLLTIGSKGQGPGEFQNPSDIYIDSNGSIYVNDFQRITIFDEEGIFRDTIPTDTNMYFWAITKGGNILAQTFFIDYERLSRTTDISLFDSKGKKNTIASFPYPIDGLVQGTIIGEFNNYRPRLYLCSINENYALYGYSSKYRLYMVNAEGKTVLIIEKDEKPEAIKSEEKDKMIENETALIKLHRKIKISRKEVRKTYKFPKTKPFYLVLNTDDRGNIYVLKFPKKGKEFCYDLFNIKGYYLYEIKIKPLVLDVIKKGFIYTRETSKESGYIKVKRYKIKNWEMIRKKL